MLTSGYVIGGRYRLVRLLGEGGMGVVWSAVNEAFGREVAIKVMLPGIAASDATALERFFTEARICGGIRDPGIVDVLDVGRDVDGAPYLVMELLDGDSLDTVLHRAGTLRPLEILPVIRDIAKTLGLAHDKGVIHRDLKPGNVFLHRLPSGQAVAKVLDFGVSKVTSAGAPTTRTRTGMVVGSPAYMSPEQAAGRVELDPRSDIYALGVILYEALSGRLPFLEENYNALMIDIAVNEPPPLATVTAGLPKPVLELVAAAMMHEREARIQTAAELARRIEVLLQTLGASTTHAVPDPAMLGRGGEGGDRRASPAGQTASALSSSVPRGARRSSVTWVLLAAVVGGLGLGLWILLGRDGGYMSHGAASTPPAPSNTIATSLGSPMPPEVTPPSTSATVDPSATSANAPLMPASSSSSQPAPSSAGAPSPGRPRPKPGPARPKGSVWSWD